MRDPIQPELQTIRESAAIATITDRAFLRITGSDATRWLNGMVTNSIQSLQPGEGNYNFLLNAQGRIQGDCTIYREPASEPATFLLATDASQIETITQTLDRFIIMDDVELTPAYTDESSLLLFGPESPAALIKLSLPALEPLRLANASTEHGPIILLTPAKVSVPVFELRAPTAILASLRAALNLQEASSQTLEDLRILEATPRFGTDIRDRDLPQETAQTHALHFAKGCYLGQEIVERIRSRGQVHRTFAQFELSGSLPTLPATLEANGKPAGELTSATNLGDRILALGYIRREFLGANLTYPNGTAVTRKPESK
jgi:folate-binding protein YgfZ